MADAGHDRPAADQDQPDRLEQARLDKLEKLQSLGHDPFGRRFDGHVHIGVARDKAPADTGVEGETVRIA